jgi:uncharacterized protein YjbJ (UPF0337 family)
MTTTRKGAIMNWDQVAGKWKQLKGKIRESWGRFKNDDNDQLKGRREQFDGFLQESFGTVKGIAEEKINEFLQSHPEYYASYQRAAKQH